MIALSSVVLLIRVLMLNRPKNRHRFLYSLQAERVKPARAEKENNCWTGAYSGNLTPKKFFEKFCKIFDILGWNRISPYRTGRRQACKACGGSWETTPIHFFEELKGDQIIYKNILARKLSQWFEYRAICKFLYLTNLSLLVEYIALE